MELEDLIGYTASFLGVITFLPQAIKTWRTKETKNISLGMYMISFLGVILWFA